MNLSRSSKANQKTAILSLFFGGLLPVIAFTVIEEKYGTLAGLIAGMLFGSTEIIYELIRYKKVNTITWIGNGLLLGLGGISLISSDGYWFKLQPALLEFGFFIFLFGSWVLKKPFMQMMLVKQNPTAPHFLKERMNGMTIRLSVFFLIHAALATWAAFYWSTESWAILKGLGITVSMVIYMGCEILWIRIALKRNLKNEDL